MPRTIPAAFLTHLEGDLLTVALAVKLTRRDTTVMGFTSASKRFTLGGVAYEPEAACDPTALRTSEGTSVDNLEVAGLIQSERVTREDIRAGLYAHALVELFLVNYMTPGDGVITLPKFFVSQITYEDGKFLFELRALSARLSQQVCDLTTPFCRVRQLFDAQCFVGGVNFDGGFVAADFQYPATVSAVGSPAFISLTLTDDLATGWLDEGKLTFSTGANAIPNLRKEIKSHTRVSAVAATVTLHEAFPFAVLVGDTMTVEAGCDRRYETCRDKFLNGGNFRGEPAIPGFGQIMKRGRR
jgi:uncharacterized phage protein (TIGR02218 family)